MINSGRLATELKPMSDQVVVGPSEQKDLHQGDIPIQYRPQNSEVVAVGAG